MALNTLEYAVQLQTILDNAAEAALTSNWMDANAGQVQYDGGNKVKMPQMEVTGLKDYDRDKGYPDGSVTLKFEDYTMTQDRGTSFQLDAMDINETNFIANATRVVSLFQKEQVCTGDRCVPLFQAVCTVKGGRKKYGLYRGR